MQVRCLHPCCLLYKQAGAQRSAIIVERLPGNAHFARRLLDADASLVEKLLNRIVDMKEALSRRKDAVAQEAFAEIAAAEELFLEALAEKGLTFESGEIIGAMGDEDEDEDKKKVHYSLRAQFSSEFDEWMEKKNDRQRLMDGGHFEIGKTSDALKSIGMKDAKIYWRKSKIQYIMEDHPVMTPDMIKNVPGIIENPIIVMKSKTIATSITMFGDIKAGDSYVMVAVELNPSPAGGLEAEFNLISSAYDRSSNNAKNLIKTSEVLYLCDKKRADTLLMSLGVQFPSDQQVYGSIGSISYKDGKVNISGKKIFAKDSASAGEVKKSRKTTTKDEFSYEYFVSKDDMPITEIDDSITYTPSKRTRDDIVEKAMKNALTVGTKNENGNPVVFVDDINTGVAFGKNGVKHGLDRRLEINAHVTVKAGEIIKNAIKINDLNPRKQTIESSYLLVGVAKNKQNEPYIVLFEVNRYTNAVTSIDVMYSLNAKSEQDLLKKNKNRLDPESPSSQDVPATLTDSTISIAQLLDFVNRYFPDILPMDVLNHYGHTSRPEGVLGKGVKHSRKTNSQAGKEEPELTTRQLKTVANYTREKVYAKKEATEVLNDIQAILTQNSKNQKGGGKLVGRIQKNFRSELDTELVNTLDLTA